MEGKEIKNLMDMNDKKVKESLTQKLYYTYNEIRKAAPSSVYIYLIAILFRYINILELVLADNFIDDWDNSFAVNVSIVLNYLNIHHYTRKEYGISKYIVFYCICLVFYIFLAFLIMVMFSKRIRKSSLTIFIYYYLSFVSLIVINGFSLSFYYIIGNFMLQNNELYFEEKNYDTFGIINIIIGAIGLLLMVFVFIMKLIYLHTDNPFSNFALKGSGRLLELVLEFEKMLIALYFLVDTGYTIIQQFSLLLLVIVFLKLYLKLNSKPYYNLNIDIFANFCEGFYFFSVITINFSMFVDGSNINENVLFYIFILNLVLAIFNVFFCLKYGARKLIYKKASVLTEEDARRTIIYLTICSMNLSYNYYREKATTYIKSHNKDCPNSQCPCFCIIRTQKSLPLLQKYYVEFIEKLAEDLHYSFPRNIDILIYLLGIKVFKQAKYAKSISIYNSTKNLKTDMIKGFELFCIR